jgi:hypothetical protein
MKPKVVSSIIRRQIRYIIVDNDNGKVLDDAESFGYKTEISANKAMWFKFQDGEDNINKKRLESSEFFKKHPEIRDFINDFYEANFYNSSEKSYKMI